MYMYMYMYHKNAPGMAAKLRVDKKPLSSHDCRKLTSGLSAVVTIFATIPKARAPRSNDTYVPYYTI